ncbi:MAG: DNA repair protein RadA [Proteobacteria bacterium]|nr:DNA repair protein RadA [Pseudomonadota bacterium]
MAKVKTVYTCNACGASFAKWMGKCESCGQWNTITEEIIESSIAHKATSRSKSAELFSLNSDIRIEDRTKTGSSELDRVLGGGLVDSAAILLGGDPGIGKSTLVLQLASFVGNSESCLYISGEESVSQIQLRAKRMGLEKSNIDLATTAHLETIISTIAQHKPKLVIVDSIQTVFSDKIDSAAGTVSQVRLATHELINFTKKTGTCLVIIGHVTKDGQIAGPRVLEHMVDTVLYFEGERGNTFRILRAIKNRFGATNEIGVFDMTQNGLTDVTNPSALFLSERPDGASGSVVLASIEGTRPVLVEIQALVTSTNQPMPRRTTLGIDHNRLSMIAAVLDKHAGYTFGSHDIFLNVTGGIKINEPAIDLAIAAALISSLLNKPIENKKIVFGEIGLAGEIRSVSHADLRIKEAEKLGFDSAIASKLKGKFSQKDIKINQIKRLDSLTEFLFD